jgi:NADH:ubiquinone oxidoreductase subunit C
VRPEELAKRIRAKFGAAILETPAFGRGRKASAWVEAKSLARISETLKNDIEFGFDLLENFSVMELEGSFVFSYFLVSTDDDTRTLVLRASIERDRADGIVDAPSVRGVWSTAEPFEREASELFGIRFDGTMSTALLAGTESLDPKFPLRRPTQRQGTA